MTVKPFTKVLERHLDQAPLRAIGDPECGPIHKHPTGCKVRHNEIDLGLEERRRRYGV